jgi:hypothetical protein
MYFVLFMLFGFFFRFFSGKSKNKIGVNEFFRCSKFRILGGISGNGLLVRKLQKKSLGLAVLILDHHMF